MRPINILMKDLVCLSDYESRVISRGSCVPFGSRSWSRNTPILHRCGSLFSRLLWTMSYGQQCCQIPCGKDWIHAPLSTGRCHVTRCMKIVDRIADAETDCNMSSHVPYSHLYTFWPVCERASSLSSRLSAWIYICPNSFLTDFSPVRNERISNRFCQRTL